MKEIGKYFLYSFGAFTLVMIIAAMLVDNDKSNTTSNEIETVEINTDSIAEAKRTDSINKILAAEETKFKKTKAGKIWKKHPDWSKEDCKSLSQGKFWIGMTEKQLKYVMGTPDDVNVSNYGSGNQYQYIYNDYSPSYFYVQDGILTAYN